MRTLKTVVVVALLTPLLAPGFPAVSQDCATRSDVEGIVDRHNRSVSDDMRGLESEIQGVSGEISGLGDRVSRSVADSVTQEFSGQFESLRNQLSEIKAQLGDSPIPSINQKLDEIMRMLDTDVGSLGASIDRMKDDVAGIRRSMSNISDNTSQIADQIKNINSTIETTIRRTVTPELQDIMQKQEVLVKQNARIEKSLSQIKDHLDIEDDQAEENE